MNTKSVYHLTLEDFQKYTVWEPTDDLEDAKREVAPCANKETMDLEGIYFVAMQFELADGTFFDGYARISWGELIMLALAVENDKFVLLAVRTQDSKNEHQKEFAKALNKMIDEVFPINYQTRIKLHIKGSVV